MATLLKTPPPPIVSLSTARTLATVRELLPSVLLEAVETLLDHASDTAMREVRAHPRRHGNTALRRQATADAQQAQRLGDERWWRLSTDSSTVARLREADSLPPLGADQWEFVVRAFSRWPGTLQQLWMVAQETVPQPPIDVEPWLRWSRRRRWSQEASRVRGDAAFETMRAESREREAEEFARRAEHARAQAPASRREAERLRGLARVHEEAATCLDDVALVAYEQAVDRGTPPAEALRLAGYDA